MTAPRFRRTEDGGILVVVLVVVIVVSVTGVATLRLTDTTYRAQTILQTKSVEEDAAKNAIDTAIELLRQNNARPRAGSHASSGGSWDKCTQQTGLLTDASANATNAFFTSGDVKVFCQPDAGSGAVIPAPGAAALPQWVIETVGGLQGAGNRAAVNGEGVRDYIPFCDEGHSTAVATNQSCEAGLYVSPYSGPVVVGSTGTSGKVVRSNSAIVNSGGMLTAKGKVEARRVCTGTINAPNATDKNCESGPAGSAISCSAGTASPTPWPATCDWLTPRTRQPDGTDLRTPVNLAPLYTPACPATGYVKMPPGRYTNAAQLNALMQCQDTTFYFPPGSYYFDFDPKFGTTRWEPPSSGTGGTPTSNIVGGEIPKDAGNPTWTACADACPEQPPRTLLFNLSTSSSGWTDPGKGTVIDDTQSSGFAFANGDGTSMRSLSWHQPEARIPERANTVIKKVELEFRHLETNAAAASFRNDSNGNQTPNLVFTAGGTGGTCRMPFPTTELSSVQRITTFLLYDSSQPTKNGCTQGEKTGNWATNMGSSLNPPLPAAINGMKVEYNARPKNAVQVQVDGLRLKVTYQGRPAPAFPGGCDATKSGVQFVFGGTSRMFFRGNSAYTELCGRFDPTAAPTSKDRYSVAILGLDEKSADLPTTKNMAKTATPTFTAFATGTGIGTVDDDLTTTATWSDNSDATVQLRLPAADAGGIPLGSYVTNVQVKVRHRETNTRNPTLAIKPEVGDAWSTTLTQSEGWTTDEFGVDWTDERWAEQRNVFDALGTPERLNGALVTFTVPATATGTKTAGLDGVEVVVTYRPPDTLRPLRGCLTTRSRLSPYANTMLGTDAEWAPPNDNSTSDANYIGNDSDGTAIGACALITTFSDKTPGQQFRVNGMIYAPTAAFDFSSTDNEGPMFTHGIVARHLTITRWDADPDVCFAGLSCDTAAAATSCAPRSVTLAAYKNDTEVMRAHVTFNDQGSCTLGSPEPDGYVDWTVLRPGP